MDFYQSLDRRRLPRHLSQKQRAPTALELLEASKKLYVQTEFLKSHRIDPNKPRLFRTDSEEELDQLYQNSLRLPAELQPASFARPSPQKLRDQTNGDFSYLSKPSSQQTHLPSTQQPRKSAFKPIQKTPPRPPKNDLLRKRQLELASSNQNAYMDIYYDQPKPAPSKIMTQSLPSYEEFIKQGAENNAKQKENRPIPPPRRSLLKKDVQPQKEPPVALPRRRQTTNYFGDIPSMTQSTYIGDTSERMRSQATSTTNLLAKSTPDLSLEFLLNSTVNSTMIPTVSNHSNVPSIQASSAHFSSNGTSPELVEKTTEMFVRPQRSNSHLSAESSKPPRPPTKPTRVKRSASNNVSRQSSSSFPSPDSSSKDSGILCNTPEMATLQMSSDVDFEERVQRWERRKTVALTPNSFLQPINEKQPTPKPTTSDSQNAVQELFDSQGIDPRLLSEIHASSSEAHEDSDVVSDFTSITAERKNAETKDDERECTPQAGLPLVSTPEKPVSQFERNARVLRWIHGCSVATSTNC